MQKEISDYKIGLLGGGQLGRMLLQSAMDLNLEVAPRALPPRAPSWTASLPTCSFLDAGRPKLEPRAAANCDTENTVDLLRACFRRRHPGT